MLRKNWDLLLIYLIAVVSAGLSISWLHAIPWLSILGIAMALFLPGYVVSQLFLPRLPVEERILVSLGLSIVITGLSGLLLNLFAVGLNSSTWGVWLSAVTLLGTGWLWLKRRSSAPESRPGQPRGRFPWQSLLLYGFGLACILLAFKISDSFSNRLDTPLTALWAAYDPADAIRLNVGIHNQEGRPMTYELVVETQNKTVLQSQKIELEDQKTLSVVIALQQMIYEPLQVVLYLPDSPNSPYRQVSVAPLDVSLQSQGSRR